MSKRRRAADAKKMRSYALRSEGFCISLLSPPQGFHPATLQYLKEPHLGEPCPVHSVRVCVRPVAETSHNAVMSIHADKKRKRKRGHCKAEAASLAHSNSLLLQIPNSVM